MSRRVDLHSVILFVAGLVVTVAAAAVGAVGYLAYALSRLLGIALDGMPAGGLVLAAVVELVLGLACTYSLLRRSREGVGV